ncbi:DUF6887 family protein [Synechocystis sp. PCC 7509]|uniref:DUF6887 family protein n=1 Tax=Synechocystis sp. PCC 7509 TaxID=927677 RepID=UPI0002AC73DE|nr:hypothetical protein [Synechocystis sp. PCC 7509]
MTKQNFEKMTKVDLLAYVKVNRTDDEAIRELFSDRRNPNRTIYPSLVNSNEDEIKQIENELSQKLKERAN